VDSKKTTLKPGVDKDYLQTCRDRAMEFALIAGAEMTGLFDGMDESISSEQAAHRLGLDARAVDIVLKALVSLGLFVQQGDRFLLHNTGRRLFQDREDPDFVGSAFRHSVYILQNWMHLSEVLKTGKPVQRERTQARIEAFMRAMDSRLDESVLWVVDQCLQGKVRPMNVLDLGGGPGRYAKAFAKRVDHVVLFDLPEVIDHVVETYEFDTIPTLQTVKGDMMDTLPKGPFQVVFLGDVCHMWSPEQNASLLKRVSRILVAGGIVAIVDFVRGLSRWAPTFAVNMLVNTPGGNTYTLQEYETWLNDAGLTDVSLKLIPGRDSQLILSVKS